MHVTHTAIELSGLSGRRRHFAEDWEQEAVLTRAK